MKSYKEKQEEEDYEEDKRRRNCDEISSSSVLIAAHSDQHHPLLKRSMMRALSICLILPCLSCFPMAYATVSWLTDMGKGCYIGLG